MNQSCDAVLRRVVEMQPWGEEWTVRAAVLRHVLISKEWPTDTTGVRLRGVRISGNLDLKAALRCPLHLESCFLDAKLVCLDQATAMVLTITGCQVERALATVNHLPGHGTGHHLLWV